MLSPLAILLLWLYSYTKRFTVLCHLVLGLVHFLVPIFAWAAITQTLAWPPVLLGGAALCSIAGSDIVYALQDAAFDRRHKLYSIPAFLGQGLSLRLAQILHALAILLLACLGWDLQLNAIYFTGLGAMALIYALFHHRLQVASLPEINRLFFWCNCGVSLSLMLFTIGSVSWLALS